MQIPWLAYYNPKIDLKTGEVKIIRCLEECGKQWRPKQGKLGWQKQKKEEQKKGEGKKQEENKQEKENKKKKPKKERTMKIKKVAEEWETWNKEKEAAMSEEEVKKLVSQRFHK